MDPLNEDFQQHPENIYLLRKTFESFSYLVDTKNTLYPKNARSKIFLHSGWWRGILNSDNCTYLKQKTSRVKVSCFKHEVDLLPTPALRKKLFHVCRQSDTV